ncbi:MAG: hypothetical protein JWR30_3864, partial [Conexibacter sp.]|nr:hypothetical protein [Conexibacter sp.]
MDGDGRLSVVLAVHATGGGQRGARELEVLL